MAPLAIAFGLLLGILGTGFYYGTGMEHRTALIPAYFGAALLLLGVLAMNAKLRMHAMHGAALVGLLGVAIPTYRVVRTYEAMTGPAATEHILMVGICAAFLAACVKSFIAARRRRKQGKP